MNVKQLVEKVLAQREEVNQLRKDCLVLANESFSQTGMATSTDPWGHGRHAVLRNLVSECRKSSVVILYNTLQEKERAMDKLETTKLEVEL